MAAGRRVSFDLPIDAAFRLAVADPHIMAAGRPVFAGLWIMATLPRMLVADIRIARQVADPRIVAGLPLVGEFRIVAGHRPVGEFRIVAGHRPVSEFRIVDLAGSRQVGESRIMAMLWQMAELAVMAQNRQVRTDPWVMALRLTMNTQFLIMAQAHWMIAELPIMDILPFRTADVSVMSHRSGMRALPFVTELRIVRSMPVMAVLRVM